MYVQLIMLFIVVSGVEIEFMMIWWKLLLQFVRVYEIMLKMERIKKFGISVEKECDIDFGMLFGSLIIQL